MRAFIFVLMLATFTTEILDPSTPFVRDPKAYDFVVSNITHQVAKNFENNHARNDLDGKCSVSCGDEGDSGKIYHIKKIRTQQGAYPPEVISFTVILFEKMISQTESRAPAPVFAPIFKQPPIA